MSNDGQNGDKNATETNPPDTASGGAPEEPDRTEPDGTPVENPSG